jgi:hypothetical protein
MLFSILTVSYIAFEVIASSNWHIDDGGPEHPVVVHCDSKTNAEITLLIII